MDNNNNNNKPTEESPNNEPSTPPQTTNQPKDKFKKILSHRVRHRGGRTEVKFQTVRTGLELLDPSWEKLNVIIMEGKGQLINYLKTLKEHHRRRFNNLIKSFDDLVPIIKEM